MERTGGGEDFGKRIRDALSEGVGEALEHILEVSNENVPVDTGELRDAGKVKHDGLSGTVSYKGPYAIPQHENLHWKHEDGGKAKFLEDAMNSEAGKVAEITSRTVRGRL